MNRKKSIDDQHALGSSVNYIIDNTQNEQTFIVCVSESIAKLQVMVSDRLIISYQCMVQWWSTSRISD